MRGNFICQHVLFRRGAAHACWIIQKRQQEAGSVRLKCSCQVFLILSGCFDAKLLSYLAAFIGSEYRDMWPSTVCVFSWVIVQLTVRLAPSPELQLST